MSGVRIHTQSPISAAKAGGITPQTSYTSTPTSTSTPAPTTSAPSDGYIPAQPGLTPTQPSTTPSSDEPPPPQPGAVPTPSPSAPRTRGPSIPPPPKVGEKPQPPGYYAKPTPTPTASQSQSLPYPPQMSIPPPNQAFDGVPPSSTTSTTSTSVHPQSASLPFQSPPATMPTAARSRANTLGHPPGYVQDPHAQEMTPDARFVTEQQEQASGHGQRSPVLPGYNNGSAGKGGVPEGVRGKEESISDNLMKVGQTAGRTVMDTALKVHEGFWKWTGDGK